MNWVEININLRFIWQASDLTRELHCGLDWKKHLVITIKILKRALAKIWLIKSIKDAYNKEG